MMLCISVDELLVCGSIHIGESEFRDELAEPGLRKSIFAHGHVSDGAFLVRSHPLGVVVAEQRFRGDVFLHSVHLSKKDRG